MKKYYVSLVLLLFCIGCSNNKIVVEDLLDKQVNGMKLLWNDEFDYEGLPNPEIWDYDIGGNGWGNNELQYYTEKRKENAKVENGNLFITAIKEEYNGKDYTSARLVTRDNKEFTYGRIDVRAKLPEGKGTWVAIWLMPADSVHGNWPRSGEIDIVEHVGFDMNKIHATVHTQKYYWKANSQKTGHKMVSAVNKNYHKYSIIWLPDKVEFLVDDEKYFDYIPEKDDSIEEKWRVWPFNQKFYLIMNLSAGGSWGAQQGMDESIWPKQMVVDYVRVYGYEEDKEAVPTMPNIIETKMDAFSGELIWEQSKDINPVKNYEIFVGDEFYKKTNKNSMQITDLMSENEYVFKVRAVGYNKKKSEFSEIKTLTTDVSALSINGIIEAENYSSMEGIKVIKCKDKKGGKNIAYINRGDFVEYVVDVPETRVYTVNLRYATLSNKSILEYSVDNQSQDEIQLKNTAGWQEWKNFETKIQLEKGVRRIRFSGQNYNLNWIKIEKD